VLKDYLDDPDTMPPAVRRNGPRSLSLNNEGDVVHAMLAYLRRPYSKEDFQAADRGVEFSVQVYKLALSLGYVWFAVHCTQKVELL